MSDLDDLQLVDCWIRLKRLALVRFLQGKTRFMKMFACFLPAGPVEPGGHGDRDPQPGSRRRRADGRDPGAR